MHCKTWCAVQLSAMRVLCVGVACMTNQHCGVLRGSALTAGAHRRPLQDTGAGDTAAPHYDQLEQPQQPAANPYSTLVLGADLYADQNAVSI